MSKGTYGNAARIGSDKQTLPSHREPLALQHRETVVKRHLESLMPYPIYLESLHIDSYLKRL
nr:hypothetical protein [Klebsiella quasipneumoniae]QFX77675.1 hypothetical protein [Klebsiella pneumoniae]